MTDIRVSVLRRIAKDGPVSAEEACRGISRHNPIPAFKRFGWVEAKVKDGSFLGFVITTAGRLALGIE